MVTYCPVLARMLGLPPRKEGVGSRMLGDVDAPVVESQRGLEPAGSNNDILLDSVVPISSAEETDGFSACGVISVKEPARGFDLEIELSHEDAEALWGESAYEDVPIFTTGELGSDEPPRGAHALGSPGGSVSHAPRGTLLKVRVLFATQLPKHGMQAPCVADAWDVYHPISSQFANGGAELDGLSAGDIPSPSCSLEAFGGKVCGLGEGVADATSYYDAGSSAAVPKDGLAPVWDHEFSVVCYAPESTFIMLSINRELESAPLARACVPLMALRCGYRAMPLRSPNGSALEEGSAALCHISMEPLGAAAQAPRKLRRITIALRDAGL